MICLTWVAKDIRLPKQTWEIHRLRLRLKYASSEGVSKLIKPTTNILIIFTYFCKAQRNILMVISVNIAYSDSFV